MHSKDISLYKDKGRLLASNPTGQRTAFIKGDNMNQIKDEIAFEIVRNYVKEKYKLEKNCEDAEPYIVWKCKTLQNWKYLLSTDLHDGMYYELTYNGDKNEWYLDVYKKLENRCIKGTKNEDKFTALTLAEAQVEA